MAEKSVPPREQRFAAAVAVRKNNMNPARPKPKNLVGGASSVGPEPAGDYDEVDTLHRALGSAIVDKVMKSREEKLARGGEVGPQEDEGDDFLDGDSEEEMDDGSYDVQGGQDQSEEEDETGEGEGGTRSQGPILQNIFSKLRRRQMGR